MSEITFQEAKEFLDNITSEDKVAIIHHDDGDGFCSGILYYDWCKSKDATTEQFTYTIGKSSLEEFNLDNFNKIIVCDLAPNFMTEELELIKDKQVFYTDHHPREIPIPKEILELITVDQGYIPSARTAGELTNLKPWLALTGTVTDAGDLYPENQDYIDKHLKQIGMTLDEFKEKVTSNVSNFISYLKKDSKKAFKILQSINSLEEIKKTYPYAEILEGEIQKFVEEYETKKKRLGDINFYYFEPKLSVRGAVTQIISRREDEEVYIFATPNEDKAKIKISARSQNRKRNMSELLKAGIEGLKDANAGGHKPAAGGIILAKDLERFKKNIRKFVEQ